MKMKKIGILTFVFNNYGTILQTYALCQALKSLLDEQSYSVDVINMNMEWSKRLSKSNRWKERIKNLISTYGLNAWKPFLERVKWQFERKKIIQKSDSSLIGKRDLLFNHLKSKIPYTKLITCDEIRNGALNSYDILISGSDQVWNVDLTESLDIYFQSFLSADELKNKKRLSYAASFGFQSIPVGRETQYKEYIKNMDSILVREEDAVSIVKSLERSDAKCVLDPTLLFDANEWSKLLPQEKIIENDYVLVYSLNSSYRIYEEANRIAQKHNLKKVCLKRNFCPPNLDNSWIDLYCVSPEQFLHLIKNAKIVITNSFHALVFSINFNTNFFAFLEKTDTVNSRLESILKKLGLESQICYEGSHINQDFNSIDFSNANSILKKEREQSLKWLKYSIVN